MAKALVELIKQKFPADVLETHSQRGDETIVVYAPRWKDIARFLRDEPRADMSMLVDLTAVDFPDRTPRFEVVAHFYSLSKGHRLRVKARVGDGSGEGAEIETLSDIWASANWADASAGISSAFASAATPISGASCFTRSSRAIRCARTTLRSASSRSSRTARSPTSTRCRPSAPTKACHSAARHTPAAPTPTTTT